MASPFESVSPLPAEVRRSLIALVVIGSTSFVSTSLLFAHMTYTLLRWKIRDIRIQREELKEAEKPAPAQEVDLHLGLAEDHYYQTKRRTPGDSNETSYSSHPEAERSEIALDTRTDQGPGQDAISCRREKPPNPLLLLIYNLLLADITLSAAYIHDGIWLSMDGIIVPSPTCSSQGWIISLGCLTTSGFLLIISIFSYLGIIRGYKATSRDVMIACSTLWLLSVLFASFGSMFFHDQSYYGRETNWCWISQEHRIWRLVIYLWGFPAMAGTCGIYGVIFYKLWREGRSSRFMPQRRSSNTTNDDHHERISTPLRPSGHHPAFLIYPCLYTFTGTPLILGSLIPPLERSPLFMGISGALLASTGLLDTILWSSIILFIKKEDLANTGLDKFTFMRTPEGRTLGNIVFVQGGKNNNESRHRRQSWHSKKEKGWWRLGDRQNEQASSSQERLPDMNDGIQMEVVTSVMIEVDSHAGHSRDDSRDRAKSLESTL